MTFEKLASNIEGCLATENANYAEDQIYIRKIRRGDSVVEGDFQTHFEKEKYPCILKNGENWQDCGKFMRCNSVSINDFQEKAQEQVLQAYKEKFQVSPKYKGGAVVFKIRDNAGLVERTPSQNDENHVSFYKADSFDVKSGIQIIQLFMLKDKCI